MSNGKILEVCLNETDTKQLTNNVLKAGDLGVSRFELCSNLHLGGLTPSKPAIDSAVKSLTNNAQLVVMIRPVFGEMILCLGDVFLRMVRIRRKIVLIQCCNNDS